MKAIRHFEEFIKEKIIKIQLPDKSRANFLIKESELSYELLNKKSSLGSLIYGLKTNPI